MGLDGHETLRSPGPGGPAPKPVDQDRLRIEDCQPEIALAGYYHFRRAAAFRYRIERSHHFILVESGRLGYKAADGHGGQAHAGDLVCFRPTPRHEHGTSPGIRFYQIHARLAPPPLDEATPHLAGVGALPECIHTGNEFQQIVDRFQDICLHIERVHELAVLRTRIAALELLAAIARLTVASIEPGGGDLWQRIRTSLDLAARRPVHIAELARNANISREHLIRGFRNRYGITPNAYHKQARLAEAARQLRAGQRPVKAIAYDLGYRDSHSFSRAFRQHWAVPPSHYRDAPPPGEPAPSRVPVNTHLTPPGKGTRPILQAALEIEEVALGDRPSWSEPT